MHILKDEHGNLIEHGSEHEHHHHHHHEHEHHQCEQAASGHCHHEHEHCDHEQCGEGEQKDKNAALLKYMLDHNTHHAAELDQMAQKLASDGREDAAEQIRKAVDEFQKGNLYLGLALSMVKE